MTEMATYFWALEHVPAFTTPQEAAAAALRNCNYRVSKGKCNRYHCDNCPKQKDLLFYMEEKFGASAEVDAAMALLLSE